MAFLAAERTPPSLCLGGGTARDGPGVNLLIVDEKSLPGWRGLDEVLAARRFPDERQANSRYELFGGGLDRPLADGGH